MRFGKSSVRAVLPILYMLVGTQVAFARPSSERAVFHSHRQFLSHNQHADFAFQFSGSNANASGVLHTQDNGDGSFTATGGILNVTGKDAGIYTLFANPNVNTSDEMFSPSKFFVFDDQLTTGQMGLLTTGGLLFRAGTLEINIYGNGQGSHTFADSQGYRSNGLFSPFVSVPELSSVLSFGSLVVTSAGLMTLRRSRKTFRKNA